MNAFDIPEFAVRFFQWSLADFHREMAYGFPLIRTIQNAHLQASLLPQLLTMSEARLHDLAYASVKVFQSKAAAHMHEPLSREEREIVSQFRLQTSPTIHDEALKPSTPRWPFARRRARHRLARVVQAHLGPILGYHEELDSALVWRHTTRIHDWVVLTDVDASHSDYQLRYQHLVLPATMGTVAPLIETATPMSMMKWLGFSLDTTWDAIGAEDLEVAARALTAICEHFVVSLPLLLEGISAR